MSYNVILADPAWPYAKRNVNKQTRFGGGVHGHYAVMTEAEIRDMADYVKSLSNMNCALMMWTTCPRMDMAIDVMKAWGFRYSTVAFAWIKGARKVELPFPMEVILPDKKTIVLPAGTIVPSRMLDERTVVGLKTIVGPGNYTGSNLEVVLLGVKGSMKPARKLVPQVIVHPRMKHSAKPHEVRDRIVSLFGDVPRIELFARDRAPGWDANGLELDGTDYKIKTASIRGTQLIVPAA